jgi:hypothetical protein
MKKGRVAPSGCRGGEVNEKLNHRTLGGFEMAAPPSPARNNAKKVARATMRRALSTIQEVAD